MSDERLRELERRWKKTGAVEDEATFLLERVRAGDLTQERLELAAHCGHQGACTALGVQHPESLETWTEGLAQWDTTVSLRAAVAAARFVYPVWSAGIPTALQDGDWVTEALRSAERCLLERTPQAERHAHRSASDAFGAAGESDLEGTPPGAAADACAFAARSVADRDVQAAQEALRLAARAESEDQVLSSVWEELLEWALGAEDPIARFRT